MTLSKSLKKFVVAAYLPGRMYKVDLTQLVSFLSCMPGLTEVGLREVHLTGELDVKQRTLSESLKKFVMAGFLPDREENLYNVSVTQLVSFLSCMPALTKVELQKVYLTGELDINHVALSESLKEFVMAGCLPDRMYKVDVTQLVTFLSCMPGLVRVRLGDVHLTGELDVKQVTLSESLKGFVIVGNLPDSVYSVNMTQLVSFLSCMPGLTGVRLWDVHMTGELDVKQVTLSESLKKFVMIRKLSDRVCNFDVTQLVSFLSFNAWTNRSGTVGCSFDW